MNTIESNHGAPQAVAPASPPGSGSRGYRPLSLRLVGFRGVKDGLGRNTLTLDLAGLAADAALIAIAGRNGCGKTTVMDNLHPYLVMPSRAGADGLGSFTYYDHVFLPESEKELVWEHEGQRYKSQLVIRLTGKRKTEAFLLRARGADDWTAATLADGTVSDGRIDSYERCVAGILGSAETFFTSVFSAQGKRQLSALRNGEVKALLADLLGLEDLRELGSRAAETARLIKAGLGVVRSEQGALAVEMDALQRDAQAIDSAEAVLVRAAAAKAQAGAALEQAQASVGSLQRQQDACAATERRRTALLEERSRAARELATAQYTLEEHAARERQRLGGLEQRIAARRTAASQRRATLTREIARLAAAVSAAAGATRAARRLPLADALAAARALRVEAANRRAARLGELRQQEQQLRQRLAGIEREAGQAVLRVKDLERRFGLTELVPCVGMDLQGRCQLLSDAREAQSLRPSAEAQLARLSAQQQEVEASLRSVRAEGEPLAGAPGQRNREEYAWERSMARASRLGRLAARIGELAQAQACLQTVEAELSTLDGEPPQAGEVGTAQESEERAQIQRVIERLAAQQRDAAARCAEQRCRSDGQLQELPAPFDPAGLQAATIRVAEARQALSAAEAAHVVAAQQEERAQLVRCRLLDAHERAKALGRRSRAIESELSGWLLFARCMSNDGVIALAIDDAGPALAALANDLLLACYGPRFTLEIRTLVPTAKGEPKESFEILVHDAEADESKSLSLMSGGEKLWIHEAMTRAIALYLSHCAGRQYGTLFSDEADGPLDADRKRMLDRTSYCPPVYEVTSNSKHSVNP